MGLVDVMRAYGGAVALTLALVAVTVWLPAVTPGVSPSKSRSAPSMSGGADAPTDDALVSHQAIAEGQPVDAVESLQFLAWIPLVALGVRRVRTAEAGSVEIRV